MYALLATFSITDSVSRQPAFVTRNDYCLAHGTFNITNTIIQFLYRPLSLFGYR